MYAIRSYYAKGELSIAGQPTKLGNLSIVDPALATLLTLLVRYPNDAKLPDQTTIRTALQDAVSYLNDRRGRATRSDRVCGTYNFVRNNLSFFTIGSRLDFGDFILSFYP